MPRFLIALLAWLFLASTATAATYNINFGIKTRVGGGAACLGLTPAAVPTGTGASNYAPVTAAGCLVPASGATAYGGYMTPTATWAAGQVHNLTVGADTVNVTVVGSAAHVNANAATDTNSTNQLRTLMAILYNASGALVVGDTVYMRDDMVFDFSTVGGVTVSAPVAGYAGAGTISNAGSGYTSSATPYDVPITPLTGTCTGARIMVLVTTGTVRNVQVSDWGSNCQPGDTLTADLGAGSGFVFTVGPNWAANIIIRSETPNTDVLPDGNFRRGGGAQIKSIAIGGSGFPIKRIPWEFQYVDIHWDEAGPSPSEEWLMGYRGSQRYGVGCYRCYVANTGEPITEIDQTGFNIRIGARFHESYVYRVARGLESQGPGARAQDTDPVTNQPVPVPDPTGLYRVITSNVFTGLTTDAMSLTGMKYTIEDNFFYNFQIQPGGHPDPIQHKGPNDGELNGPFGTIKRNISIRGVGVAGQIGPQGIFLTDARLTARIASATIENNIMFGAQQNQLIMSRFTGQQVRFNTILSQLNPVAVSPSDVRNAEIRAYEGNGGYFDRNVANDIEMEVTQLDPDVTVNNVVMPIASGLGAYTAMLCDYDDTDLSAATTYAQALALAVPCLNGTARLADNTFVGALFPDASWNNGTVYLATPPSSLTSAPDLTEAEVAQPVTVLVQADAAANQDITLTPGVTGVTGGFSPTNPVMLTGQSSVQFTFTATSAGTANITMTNNRSLSGPAAFNVLITSPVVGPTAYTQSLNRSTVSLGGAIQITYTLNAPASTPIVITPGVSGVSGVFSAPEVTINFGETTGSATFVTGSLGSGQFSAANDSALPNPANQNFEVVPAVPAQKMRFVRPGA